MEHTLDSEHETRATTAELVTIIEAIGLVAPRAERLATRPGATDAARSRLVLLGLQLGLWPGELTELIQLYDDTPAPERELSHFIELLSCHQRYVCWRNRALRPARSAPRFVGGERQGRARVPR